jgi:ferrous iron transport protein A
MAGGLNCGHGCCGGGSKASDASTLPLSDAPAGKRIKVASILGGRQLCARMAALGIYPGVEMELLYSGCGSPRLVRVHGGTLSLGAGICEKIRVTALM